MRLIIAEKPDLGKAIVEALPGRQKNNRGYIQKGEDIVTWCFGHMLELKPPHQYDERYKKWNIADLPIFFSQWATQPIPDKQQQIDVIRQLVQKADLVILIEKISSSFVNKKEYLFIDIILKIPF